MKTINQITAKNFDKINPVVEALRIKARKAIEENDNKTLDEIKEKLQGVVPTIKTNTLKRAELNLSDKFLELVDEVRFHNAGRISIYDDNSYTYHDRPIEGIDIEEYKKDKSLFKSNNSFLEEDYIFEIEKLTFLDNKKNVRRPQKCEITIVPSGDNYGVMVALKIKTKSLTVKKTITFYKDITKYVCSKISVTNEL